MASEETESVSKTEDSDKVTNNNDDTDPEICDEKPNNELEIIDIEGINESHKDEFEIKDSEDVAEEIAKNNNVIQDTDI